MGTKTVFVLGGASSVWEDFDRAKDQYGYDSVNAVIAVNDVGMFYPNDLVAWCSLHGVSLLQWMNKRKLKGYPAAKLTYTGLDAWDEPLCRARLDRGVQALFQPEQTVGGSSGLFACKVALDHLQYNRVILCGVPMTIEGAHFFNAEKWVDAPSHHLGWEQALPHIKDKVFSMSGWTRQLLGTPPKRTVASAEKERESQEVST